MRMNLQNFQAAFRRLKVLQKTGYCWNLPLRTDFSVRSLQLLNKTCLAQIMNSSKRCWPYKRLQLGISRRTSLQHSKNTAEKSLLIQSIQATKASELLGQRVRSLPQCWNHKYSHVKAFEEKYTLIRQKLYNKKNQLNVKVTKLLTMSASSLPAEMNIQRLLPYSSCNTKQQTQYGPSKRN